MKRYLSKTWGRQPERPTDSRNGFFLYETKQVVSGVLGLETLARRAAADAVNGNPTAIATAKEIRSFLQDIRREIEANVHKWLYELKVQPASPLQRGKQSVGEKPEVKEPQPTQDAEVETGPKFHVE